MADLPEIRKILVATDGSDLATRAVDYAVALTRQSGAALIGLYVVDVSGAFKMGIHETDALDELRRDGRTALETIDKRARAAGVAVETHLRDGSPGACVVGEADKLGADLIVLGSSGLGGVLEALLGSVSHHVLQHANVPVLVVRPEPRRK